MWLGSLNPDPISYHYNYVLLVSFIRPGLFNSYPFSDLVYLESIPVFRFSDQND